MDLERRSRRQEQRFASITDEMQALVAGQIAEPSTVLPVDDREPCAHCGRKFAPDRLERHMVVCDQLKWGMERRGTFSVKSMLSTSLGAGSPPPATPSMTPRPPCTSSCVARAGGTVVCTTAVRFTAGSS